MKKLLVLTIALMLMLTLVLAGCGTTDTTEDAAEEPATEAEETEEAEEEEETEEAEEPVADEGSEFVYDGETATVEVNYNDGEWFDTHLELLAAKFPNITVDRNMVATDILMAQIAAGTAPDIIRIKGYSEVPLMASQHMLLNLDPYVMANDTPVMNDFPAADLYKWDAEKQQQGVGSLYGFLKDFSIDTSMWIDIAQFEAAGLAIPEEDVPMTYQELAVAVEALTVVDSGKFLSQGLSGPYSFLTETVNMQLFQQGTTIWSDDYKTVDLTSAESVEAFQYWMDLMVPGYVASTLHPPSDGWGGSLLHTEELAMLMHGYWYNSMLYNNVAEDAINFKQIPTPVWEGGTPVAIVNAGVGGSILASTDAPAAAYAVLEWFFVTGEPPMERAVDGWGVPPSKELVEFFPDRPHTQQALRVVMFEMDNNYYPDETVTSPYLTSTALNSLVEKYITPVLYGEAELETALAEFEADANQVIQDNMLIAGVS